MGLIYHMLPAVDWAAQSSDQPYRSATLTTEGFIHCTGERALLPEVANRFYRSLTGDFVVLMVDEDRITAPVKWEPADGRLFPHIYGPLNLDAILDIAPFPRDTDGRFLALAWPE